MKELLKSLDVVPVEKAKNLVLLDTCFIIANLENNSEMNALSSLGNLATTSFNLAELVHVKHLKHNIKKDMRKFLKSSKIKVVDINVLPGEWENEQAFVKKVEPKLLEKVRDASDAVLIATAIKTSSDVATKDKHHLFTTKLENFLNKYNIRVYKELKDFKQQAEQHIQQK